MKPKRVVTGPDDVLQFVRYERETGELFWTANIGKARIGQKVGTVTHGRLYFRFGGSGTFAHRLVWRIEHGAWPDHVIDHIDGNPLNNRIGNLRAATLKLNAENIRKAHKDNQSGYLGVQRHGSSFRARIFANGKQHRLGTFQTAEEASSAYVEAKRRMHAGCTI